MSNGALALAPSPFHVRPFLRKNPNIKDRYFTSNGASIYWSKSNSTSPHRRCRVHCTEIELPFLPFVLQEVLIPSESKTLHLYEPRFLSLLEEAISVRNKTFVHFVLDPLSRNESSFGANYCCLIHVENIEKVSVGALVSIRGIGRVDIVKLVEMEPYLRGVVVPVRDNQPDNAVRLDSKLSELKDSIISLHSLEIKLKVPKKELLQTQIKSSLLWAEKEFENCNYQNFVPELPERVSFSAFQPVSGMLDSEIAALQREKLRAMESKDTEERLQRGIEFVKESTKMIAARLAIQSL